MNQRVFLWILTFAQLSACARASAPGLTDAPAPAHAELDALDTRAPLPLLPQMAQHQKQNMRDHLVAVQEIVSALATDDLVAVQTAARRIGVSQEMVGTCSHMGAAAPGFTERALDFHRAADRIAVAAEARERAQVLTELATTLQSCTSCHATWKQQVVDDTTWQRLTHASLGH